MEVQVFLQEELASVPDIPDAERLVLESGISFHQAQAGLAQQAGFDAQVKIHRRKEEEFQRKLLPLPPFPVVSEAEYGIWCLFLPTSYPRREWAGYRFDLIPPDVLEVIRAHGYLFDEMEIRTPERMKSDPVIFGTRGSVRYIVARWAESRLVSFSEVTKAVRRFSPNGMIIGSISSAITLFFGALSIWVEPGLLAPFFVFLLVTASMWHSIFSDRREIRKLTRALALSVQPVNV